jgi:dipeptidyl aminopeptidase/acylaminoacyl peptidase
MRRTVIGLAIVMSAFAAEASSQPTVSPPGLETFIGYSFPSDLTAAGDADRIAWIETTKGVRNVWLASGPDFRARKVTSATEDDGQQLTGLVISGDGSRIAWTRGGEHHGNYRAAGNLQPNPASSTEQQQMQIWSAATAGGPAAKVADGDAPALSATGKLAYIKDDQAWSADPAGKGKPEKLFFDRGRVTDLSWSPDGTKLAFVSRRDGDHSFIGIYSGGGTPIAWMAPSTAWDENPVWSPDGKRIAFSRRTNNGGAPRPFMKESPQPWSIWVADIASGEASVAWRSAKTLEGSYPSRVPDGIFLMWAAGDRLTFRTESHGWPHLYSVPATGGEALHLTPGDFMVEHVALSRDGKSLLYSANTGASADDDERRHVYRVPIDRAAPVALTSGEGLEWTPVPAGASGVAMIAATVRTPPRVHLTGTAAGGLGRALDAGSANYPANQLVAPRHVTFKAADGLTIHGQLFEGRGGAKRPAMIYIHGGPTRQMLLGWNYSGYYSHSYAMNQYLASRGFTVLSVNYRLGIGYGRAFQNAARGGLTGSSEYQDIVAAGRFLQSQPNVDDKRIGLWGGSYGGLLTALGLARNSDMFRAGVDLHGVHDWSRRSSRFAEPQGYEKGEWPDMAKIAFESSPVASMKTWRSPVLLIHGDDDRNVAFDQTIDLARRLEAEEIPYEELVLPNELHDFQRYDSWRRSDTATVKFLEAKLKP